MHVPCDSCGVYWVKGQSLKVTPIDTFYTIMLNVTSDKGIISNLKCRIKNVKM